MILLYYLALAGQKFARNHSISYGFRDIHTFSFSAKIQDGCQKWQKLKFFPLAQDTPVLPCGSKIHLKSLYLLRFARYSHFFIFCSNPRWPTNVVKIEIFPLCIGYSCTTLWVKNSHEITISYGFRDIHTFSFSPRHRILLYYPTGQKFAQNCSISYRFQDIFNVLLSAKIQDGRQKWRKHNIHYPVGQKFAQNRSISYSF